VTLVVGIDLGTTSTKVALVSSEHGLVSTASREATLSSPSPGFAEASPAQWWDNVVALIPEVLDRGGAMPADVAAIATSGMVPAVVVTDDAGRPRRPAILQNDARAVVELAELAGELAGVDLVTTTGSPLSQQSVAPTLRWLSRHQPHVLDDDAVVVGSYDWLSWMLGARPHVEENWAVESGLFDLDLAPFAPVAAAVPEAGCVPAPVAPGAIVGELGTAAAAATGFVAGTPLVVGGADHVLSAVAAGLRRGGDLLVKLGGAGDIMLVTEAPLTDRRLYLDRYPMPGRWIPNGCMATSGSLLRWLQHVVGGVELEALDVEAAGCPQGDVLCLPYFLGEKTPLHDPELRGAFVGLHLGHGRGALHRAALEAIGFGVRHHLEVFGELGFAPTDGWVSDGGSRSALFTQIVADITGVSLRPVVDHPGASLGAALLAMVGIGAVADLAATPVAPTAPVVAPDPVRHERYSDTYALWRQLGVALAPTSHALARRPS